MFCPNCGKQMPDGSPFCLGCGCRLDAPAAVPGPDAGKKPSRKGRKAAAKKARRKRPWRVWLLRVLAVLALLLTAGAAVWHFLGPRPEDLKFPYSRRELELAAAAERPYLQCAIDGTNGRIGTNEGVVGSCIARVGNVIMEAKNQGVTEQEELTGYIEVDLLDEEWGFDDPLRSHHIDGYYVDLVPFAGKVWCWELTVSADGSDGLYSLVHIDPATLEKTVAYIPEEGWNPGGELCVADGKLWFGMTNWDTNEAWVCHLEPRGDMLWDFPLDDGCSYMAATNSGLYVREWREDADSGFITSYSLYSFYGEYIGLLPQGDYSTTLLAETDDGIYMLLGDSWDASLVRVDTNSGYVVDLTDSLTAQGADLSAIGSHSCDTDNYAFYLLAEDGEGTDLYRIDDGTLDVTHMFRDSHDMQGQIPSLYLLGTTHCLIEYTSLEDEGGTVTSIRPLTG